MRKTLSPLCHFPHPDPRVFCFALCFIIHDLVVQSCRPNSFLRPENFFFLPEAALCIVPPLAMFLRSLPLRLRLLSGRIDFFMGGAPSLVVGLWSLPASPFVLAAGRGQFCGVVRLCSLGCLGLRRVVGLRGCCESTGDCATNEELFLRSTLPRKLPLRLVGVKGTSGPSDAVLLAGTGGG
jgi:hypothetical protein